MKMGGIGQGLSNYVLTFGIGTFCSRHLLEDAWPEGIP
jgi:hypothetical protein